MYGTTLRRCVCYLTKDAPYKLIRLTPSPKLQTYLIPCTRGVSSRPPHISDIDKQTNQVNYVAGTQARSKMYIKDTDIEQEYGLTKQDLDGIPFKKLRNAYEDTENIFPAGKYESKLYRRDLIVNRALQKFKTRINVGIETRKVKKKVEEEDDIADAMSSLINIMMSMENKKSKSLWQASDEHKRSQVKSSLKVVGVSIATNIIVGLGKFGSYLYTGSASMLSEAIHSIIDTMNQLFLAFGLLYSLKKPHSDHPYGFDKARYVYALISGVSIFEMGCVFTIKHGVTELYHPTLVLDHSLSMAYVVLLFSALIESFSLWYAFKQARVQSKLEGIAFSQYLFKGHEPTTIAVLAEDIAAVAGIAIAGIGLGLSAYTSNHVYDAIGSIGVGTLLGSMAIFIVIRNKDALVGRSMNHVKQSAIVDMLEQDPSVLSVNDVKSMVEGPSYVRFKAEIFFDTDEITRKCLDSLDSLALMKELKRIKTEKEFEAFMRRQSSVLIDTLALEVDRLEYLIKKKYPEIRHVDLEIL